MKTRKLLRRYQRQIDSAVDRILTLLYISLVVTGISLVLHFERIIHIF